MPKMTDEQQRAVLHDNGNILISASAGSGKTFTMIERIERLMLEKNVSVNDVLCVTFTEKAAFEMKEKLKKALKENVDGANRTRILKEIVELPTADISTLHAFCAKLIRNNFYKVGLSPDFSVADESLALVMRNESIDKAMREFYDSGAGWFYTLIDRHERGRTDSKLRDIIADVYDFYVSEANPESALLTFREFLTKNAFNDLLAEYKDYLNKRLEPIKLDLEECYRFFLESNLKKSADLVKLFLSDIEKILDSDDVYIVKSYEKYSVRFEFDRGLSDWELAVKEKVNAHKKLFLKITERFSKHLNDKQEDFNNFIECANHIEDIIKIVNRFSQIYEQEKRQENILDFNDLEHFALKLLLDEQVLTAVRNKYKYVFVDEYQDINAVQEQIINSVSKDNLFMVGDVKQSIYGFRGCKPEFFTQKFEKMQREGQTVVKLNHNFRSAGAVINLVNTIFDFCMKAEFFGYDYKTTSRLIAGADWAKTEKGRAELHYFAKTKALKQESVPEVYNVLNHLSGQEDEEKSNVASLVTKIINDELTKTYYDFNAKEHKRVQLNDIVILTRGKNTKYVKDLVKGLNRHGIGVTSEVKENACDFPEVEMMINALKAVDCFEQDIPLASVMKSPIGKFTNEDFLEIVRHYEDSEEKVQGWSFIHAFKYYSQTGASPLKERLISFKEYFDKIRVLADFIGAKGVLDKLISQNNVESYLLAESLGGTKLARLKKFVQSSIVNDKKLTVKEFLNKIQTSPKAFEFSTAGEQEDTVRVMTIHASKGLEFPVVIVCGLERAFNTDDEKGDILLSKKYGMGVNVYDEEARVKKETLIRGVMKEHMRSERIKEEMRLFYVALTRAMFSLHLTVESDKDTRVQNFYGADKFFDYIPPIINFTQYDDCDFAFTNATREIRKVLVGKADEKAVDQIKQNLAYAYPHVQDTVVPLKTNVTASMRIMKDDQPLTYVLFDEPSPDTERGNVAHKILEYYNFKSSKPLKEQCLNLIERGVLSKEQVELVNLERIEKALSCQAFKLIKDCKLYREKAFLVGAKANQVFDTTSTEQVVVQGVIDLLAVGEKCYVFDYKYSSLDDKSLVIKYKKQLDLYAQAVESVLNKNVEKKVIVNLFTGQWVEV